MNCWNHSNLAKIRFAKEIWSLEYKQVGFAAPTVPDVIQYLRTGGPSCPLDTFSNIWTSYTLNLACQNPICQYSFSHLLEEPED